MVVKFSYEAVRKLANFLHVSFCGLTVLGKVKQIPQHIFVRNVCGGSSVITDYN